jgi:drug/metabolite transporter, DME family
MEGPIRTPSRAERLDSFALAAGLVAPLTWGLTGVFVRLLHGVPTLAIVAGRLLIAALVLFPWLLLGNRQLRHAFHAPLAAAMGAYYILATEAFVRAPVVEVTLIVGSAPVIAVGLERIRGIRAVRQQLIGAVIAVVGLILFLGPGANVSSDRALGYLFALGAAVASAAYAVWLRACALGQSKPDPLALTVGACLLGTAASLFLLGREFPTSMSLMKAPTDLIHLALLGTVSTAVPTLAFGIASVRLPPVVTTSLGLTTPLFAAFFAGLLLNEWPAPATVPAAFLAIAGVTVVLRSPLSPSHRA